MHSLCSFTSAEHLRANALPLILKELDKREKRGQTTIFVIELNAWSDPYSLGEARDIAQAIVYLESAGFVTGEILHVDGGQSAGH
jgi:NAD(P)-dependent dehydrogenase (short-subunit alcohol dehydrogenase family)